MQKFLLRTFLFLLSLYFLLKIPGSFDRFSANEQSADLNRLKLAAETENVELLFTGGSYTYSSVIPQYFDSLGIQSFNLGISGSSAYFNRLVLDDFYNNAKSKPKYLVFDLSLFAFSYRSDDFYAYPIHRYLQQPLSHEALIYKFPELLDIYPKLLLKSFFKGFSAWHSDEHKSVDSSAFYRGFYPQYSVLDLETAHRDSLLLSPFKNSNFNTKKVSLFLETAEFYHKKGVKIYWFEAQTGKLSQYFNDVFKAEYQKALKKIRSSDFLKEIPLNDLYLMESDFRNSDHTNIYGAQKISSALSAFMSKEISPSK